APARSRRRNAPARVGRRGQPWQHPLQQCTRPRPPRWVPRRREALMSDQEGVEVERRHDNFFESLVKDMMPLQQRQLLGTLLVFATLVVVGWVGINEPRRMQTYTAQYDGRSIERGAVLYTDNCASCHGVDGRGIPS